MYHRHSHESTDKPYGIGIRLTGINRCSLLPHPQHAGVSSKALGAQSLIDSDTSPYVHHGNKPRRDIDPDHSATVFGDNHSSSISPNTTSGHDHGSSYQSLLIPLPRLQLDV